MMLRLPFSRRRAFSAGRPLTDEIKEAMSMSDVLSLCKKHDATLDETHMAAAWQRLGRLSEPGMHLAGAENLVQISVRLLPDAGPRQVAIVAHGAARATYSSGKLFDTLAKRSQERLRDFNPQEVANTVWALAKLSRAAPELFDAVVESMVEDLREFNSQNLANTVWSFATLKHVAPRLFDVVAAMSDEHLLYFTPQELANTVWAFAKLGHGAPKFFDGVATISKDRLMNFKPQSLANTVWAFATLKHAAPSLFDAVAEIPEQCMLSFSTQDYANTVWAFAKLNHPAPNLFDTVARCVETCFSKFKPQELANTVWAFAKFSHIAPKLFDAVAEIAEEHLRTFTLEELANAVWAFATVGHVAAPKFIDAVAKDAEKRLSACDTVNAEFLCFALVLEQCACKCFSECPAIIHEITEIAFLDVRSILQGVVRDTRKAYHLAKLRSFGLTGMGSLRTKQLLGELGIVAGITSSVDIAGSDCEAFVWCTLEYSILLDADSDDLLARISIEERGRTFLSGTSERDNVETSRPSELRAITLSFPRHRDAEYLALSSVVRAIRHVQLSKRHSPMPWKVQGSIRMNVSKAPCLSCVSAMAQFRRLFPEVHLNVSFVLDSPACRFT